MSGSRLIFVKGRLYILIDPYRSPFCMLSEMLRKDFFELNFFPLVRRGSRSVCRTRLRVRAQALYVSGCEQVQIVIYGRLKGCCVSKSSSIP